MRLSKIQKQILLILSESTEPLSVRDLIGRIVGRKAFYGQNFESERRRSMRRSGSKEWGYIYGSIRYSFQRSIKRLREQRLVTYTEEPEKIVFKETPHASRYPYIRVPLRVIMERWKELSNHHLKSFMSFAREQLKEEYPYVEFKFAIPRYVLTPLGIEVCKKLQR